MASGEVAWFGAGRIGRDDGRVVLVRREMLETFAPSAVEAPSPLHTAILDALGSRGALFFSDAVAAVASPHNEVLEALWDLVWLGAVTNDTLAPVRGLSWGKRASSVSHRGRIGRLPPESAGRWALVRPVAVPESRAALTARSHARAASLLERLGIVTREGVAAEDLVGGFSSVYPVLKAMEDAGRVRRGYFVEGLGAAQFAFPGAAERVRAERDTPDDPVVVVLAASDPAQPYGATIVWPRDEAGSRKSFQRVAGAHVVLAGGDPVLYLDRSGRGLLTFPAARDEPHFTAALGALAAHPVVTPGRGLTVERIDGQPALDSPFAASMYGAGFVRGFRGLTLRPTAPAMKTYA